MKICVIGGGSTYTPELMEGLIKHSKELNIDVVFLLDIPEASEKFETVAELCDRMLEKAGKPFKLIWTYDEKKALWDADFVVQQFRPGGIDGRIRDEKIPLKYGLIGQETTGVGGFSSALRAFPVIEKYLNLIERIAPKAFVINFTNPSGMISEFILNYLGYERAIGLCNVPINIINSIAQKFGVSRDQVFLKYYGLNHLSWVEKVEIDGEDKTQEVLEEVYKPENIPSGGLDAEMLKSLKMILNPYMRYYYATPEMLEEEIKAEKSEGTRGEVVKKLEKELLELYKNKDLKEKPEQLSKRGGALYSTAAVELIRDLYLGNKRIHILNVKNNGAVTNLPNDYVLEVPTLVRKYNTSSITIGEASKLTIGLIHTIKNFERLTIEAHIESSREKALQALLIHPLGPKGKQAKQLLDEIIEANKRWITLT
ncbi:MAG: 6-phospho-beta-glucosidase [Thermotogaceae bacterium]|nr:6-phospho-beta-glucosidase [Thermotogaceae bacterium]